MVYPVISDALIDRIEAEDADQQTTWLFLEQNEEFRDCWEVSGLSNAFFFDLEPFLGPYRLLTPDRLDTFQALCAAKGYQPVFIEDPQPILEAHRSLDDDPPVELHSSLPHTRKGFLPWQIKGFNAMVRPDIKSAYVVWLTGSGKSALMAAAIRYLWDQIDIALVVVKAHNKIETQRKLLELADIDSVIVDGTRAQRQAIYTTLQSSDKNVIITNYEKFREDTDEFKALVDRKRLLAFWDEGPNKLSNRQTKLYGAVKDVLYKQFSKRPRPSWMRHFILSATPIENSPEDVFSMMHLTWPGLLGSAADFHNQYVASYNYISGKPQTWHRLDHLEARLHFLTHRVTKDDPEVKAIFPEALPLRKLIDWNPKHRAVYDQLTGKAREILIDVEDANVLAMIQIMQMLCDAPSMIKESAKNREKFLEMLEVDEEIEPVGSDIALRLLQGIPPEQFTDQGHTKLDTWREIICDKHPDEKIVTHSTWADYIFPVCAYWLQKWGVSYVVYAGTPKQKQIALDTFREDPDIRVFLSGDSGADSIDIPQARVGVNFNVPWKWTTMTQREGRRDRVNSEFDTIYTYTLLMANSIDERKLAICERKRQYHEAVFGGHLRDEVIGTGMTKDELVYMLTGDSATLA